MSWKDIKPGKYAAKAVKMRFGESSQKGTPFAEVEFKLENHEEYIRWTGYLTEKTLERTMDVLALLNYNQDPECKPGCISTSKVVYLSIELEAGSDGKEYPRVKWVNAEASSGFETLKPEQLKAKLGGVDLKAEMAAAKARLGIKPVKNHAPGADGQAPF